MFCWQRKQLCHASYGFSGKNGVTTDDAASGIMLLFYCLPFREGGSFALAYISFTAPCRILYVCTSKEQVCCVTNLEEAICRCNSAHHSPLCIVNLSMFILCNWCRTVVLLVSLCHPCLLIFCPLLHNAGFIQLPILPCSPERHSPMLLKDCLTSSFVIDTRLSHGWKPA